jgi:hypothetical protein
VTDTFQHGKGVGGQELVRSLPEDLRLREYSLLLAKITGNKKGMPFDIPPQWFLKPELLEHFLQSIRFLLFIVIITQE